MKKHDSYPKIAFKDKGEFEAFLKENHEKVPGIWVKFAKKKSGVSGISYDEALEVALCYGWIDGQAASFDEIYSLVKFTPRGPRSIWSKRNIGIVEKLIKEKKMRTPGLLKIQEAKKDGRWERAYGGSADAVIPEDFLREVKKDKKACEFFQTLNKSNLFVIYYRLQTAAKPEARERRMIVILEMMKENKKFY